MTDYFVIVKHGILKFALKEDVNLMTPMEIATREFRDLWVLATGRCLVFSHEEAQRAIELVNTLPHSYELELEAVTPPVIAPPPQHKGVSNAY